VQRRSFLSALLALPLAASAPLRRLIVAPLRPKTVPLTIDLVNQITIKSIMPAVRDHYFNTSPLWTYLQTRTYRPGDTFTIEGTRIGAPVCGFAGTVEADVDEDGEDEA
jgi:hypothetical protein